MWKLFFIFFLMSIAVVGQTAISGHIALEPSEEWEKKVYLSKLRLSSDSSFQQEVAWSPIAESGSFSFKSKYFSEKDAVYRLYVNNLEQAINDTVGHSKDLILSRTDKVIFARGLVSEYKNTNVADAEWQKMQDFQKKLDKDRAIEDTISQAYDAKLKAYTKDSLKILLVKLIGLQQLAQNGLLDRDIDENPTYYLALLSELEKSEMDAKEYRFLSRRLAYLTQERTARNYEWSKTLNIILGILVVVVLFFAYGRSIRRPAVFGTLSKRERNIHALILQGKSNKEIANELFISLSTVKTHITNIYGKLKVSNRTELLKRYQS